MKQDHRRARLFGGHFHVLPGDTTTPTGLQGFQRGFFCREARGIMLSGDRAARFTVSALGIGKHPLGKTRSARDGFAHAPNFDNVDSN
jgi:hypothetical protein